MDALLGRQTRSHSDLDLGVARTDLASAEAALARIGFAHDLHERPGLPARFVLRDPFGREVDFHPLVFDREGNGHQLGDGRWGTYPAAGLEGHGFVEGRAVRCLTPEIQLALHCGYEPGANDRRDIALLTERFELEAPGPHSGLS